MTSATVAWPLFGHSKAEAAFISARESGQLHHAWMLEGPSGIGKARLARRMAAYMLGATNTDGTLDSSTSDPVVQKLKAEAHPDLRWLSRRPDHKGKVKQDIPVDDIRALNEFFSLKAGLGGWRIGVIDSIDELNRSGANAILKTLEEPPARCLLIVISHRTRPVLPTIRSRCRLLRLVPLSEEDTRRALDQSEHGSARESTTQMLSRGRPGNGLRLSSSTGIASANAARNFLRGLPKPSDASLSDVIGRCGADDIAFEAFSNEVFAWLEEMADSQPTLAASWLGAASLIGAIQELNMDRTQATAKLVAELQKAAQRG